MEFINTFFEGLNISPNLAGDLSLLLLFVGVSIGLGFFLGRARLITILISIYIARALMTILPAEWMSFSLYGEALFFVIIFLGLFFVDRRLFDLHLSNTGTDIFWRIFVMGVLVAGLLVSSILYYLPKAVALNFISPTLYSYFASATALTVWMILPLVGLLFINNRLK